MKTVTNAQLIIEALKKHTKEEFRQDKTTDEVFESKTYVVTEEQLGLYAVETYSYDRDTGGNNYFTLGEDLTLADVIDTINKDKSEI